KLFHWLKENNFYEEGIYNCCIPKIVAQWLGTWLTDPASPGRTFLWHSTSVYPRVVCQHRAISSAEPLCLSTGGRGNARVWSGAMHWSFPGELAPSASPDYRCSNL